MIAFGPLAVPCPYEVVDSKPKGTTTQRAVSESQWSFRLRKLFFARLIFFAIFFEGSHIIHVRALKRYLRDAEHLPAFQTADAVLCAGLLARERA